jgi:hypothetical protein
LNITYTVKPQGSAVQLVVDEGHQGVPQSVLNDPAYRYNVWSWNLIEGSGMIQLEIRKSSSYYLAVANLKSKDVEVTTTDQVFGLSFGFSTLHCVT